MSGTIVIIDTSVFVEILAVPGSLNPARRVLIWSLDDDLSGYDTGDPEL